MQEVLSYNPLKVRMLYEAAVKRELASRADFIEDVIAGIGASLGGKKAFRAIEPMLKSLRGEK